MGSEITDATIPAETGVVAEAVELHQGLLPRPGARRADGQPRLHCAAVRPPPPRRGFGRRSATRSCTTDKLVGALDVGARDRRGLGCSGDHRPLRRSRATRSAVLDDDAPVESVIEDIDHISACRQRWALDLRGGTIVTRGHHRARHRHRPGPASCRRPSCGPDDLRRLPRGMPGGPHPGRLVPVQASRRARGDASGRHVRGQLPSAADVVVPEDEKFINEIAEPRHGRVRKVINAQRRPSQGDEGRAVHPRALQRVPRPDHRTRSGRHGRRTSSRRSRST